MMGEIVRRIAVVLILGPPWLVFLAGVVLTTAPIMALLNALLGGRGGFYAYMRETQIDLTTAFLDMARYALASKPQT
jgi:hypothetical protein